MSRTKFVCIDAHTCGNPVRVITEGHPNLIGETMSEIQPPASNSAAGMH